MDETLRLLELWAALDEHHRTQVLWLAETLDEWETRNDSC